MAVLYVKDIETGKFVPIKQLQGYTPQKGIDYFTDAEKAELIAEIENGVVGDIDTALDELHAYAQALVGGES